MLDKTEHFRDIFVIGGSAGAIEELRTLLHEIDENFKGILFVAIHLSPYSKSELDLILGRECKIPVKFAQHKEKFEPGHVYLAVPNRHFLVDEDCMYLTNGPRENRSKPAIDPLFRSAAVSMQQRVTGILLSGNLDDGSAGLLAVKDCGGETLIQKPETARFPDMLHNARAVAPIDNICNIREMGQFINKTAKEKANPKSRFIPENLKLEVDISLKAQSDIDLQNQLGSQVPFICPECNGPLWEMKDKRIKRYRCHTGHAYTLKNLAAGQEESIEEALWAALRTLEEKIRTLNTIAEVGESGVNYTEENAVLQDKIENAHKYIDTLRKFLLKFEGEHGDAPNTEEAPASEAVLSDEE
ncbi:MAG: chemotaxis protein CheB [Halobacteriovoraceae bacterium]|nr:chemotaxis protein CheB [Halobacteriovoraceae bacterium]|tara:strand:- start:5274 stop:6344 length:1071 start_codon:yes stop_codon:yes gene_type:complete